MMEFKTCCCEYFETAMDMVRTFSLKDVSIFKFALISFGMLAAIHNPRIAKKLAPLIWIVMIASFVYLICNYCFYLKARKDNL